LEGERARRRLPIGWKPTDQFCHLNKLELICRAHQLALDGIKYSFDNKNLVTVWSAPNYCYRCGNLAAIMSFDEHLDRSVKTFKEVPESTNNALAKTGIDYFM